MSRYSREGGREMLAKAGKGKGEELDGMMEVTWTGRRAPEAGQAQCYLHSAVWP